MPQPHLQRCVVVVRTHACTGQASDCVSRALFLWQPLRQPGCRQGGLQQFNFEGRPLKLVSSCAVLATLRTGSGRVSAASLPDNLAAQFRQLQLPIPDIQPLAQLLLEAQGGDAALPLGVIDVKPAMPGTYSQMLPDVPSMRVHLILVCCRQVSVAA